MKKVVSATLAGALAVGMVPAMAFAAEGDAELELLVSTEAGINGGTIILKDGQTDGMSFVKGSKDAYLAPIAIQPMDTTAEADVVDVKFVFVYQVAKTANESTTFVDGGKKFTYAKWGKYAVSAGAVNKTPESGDLGNIDDLPVGKYLVGVKDNSGYVVKEALAFEITAQAITGLELFDNTNAVKDLEDEAFAYDKVSYKNLTNRLGLKIGDKDVTDQFDIVKVTDPATNKSVDAIYAGTYNVELKGKATGDYANQSITLPLTIGAFDIAKAGAYIAPIATTVAVADGYAPGFICSHALSSDFEIKSWSPAFTKAGAYTAVIGVKDTVLADPLQAAHVASIKSETTVNFIVADDPNYSFKAVYDLATDLDFDNAGDVLKIDYSKKDAAFDASKVVVTFKDLATGKDVVATADQLVVSYTKVTDAGEVPCEASALQSKGNYKVKVSLNPAAFDYKIAAPAKDLEVQVTGGEAAVADISITYKGSGVYGATPSIGVSTPVYYTGADVLDSISFAVRTKEGVTVPADQYTLEIKKTKDAQDVALNPAVENVTEIVDAGTYTIAVKSSTYTIATNLLTVKVTPAEINAVSVKGFDKNASDVQMFLYTGKDITPALVYNHDSADYTPDVAVPEGYTLKITKYVDPVTNIEYTSGSKLPKVFNAAGYYEFELDDASLKDNYAFNVGGTLKLVVTEDAYFTDVPSDAWYAEAVYEAKKAGIVNGIEGTKLFAPTKAVKRGDFVCMLYNLAMGTPNSGSTTGDLTTGTKSFDDVNQSSYYAKAIAWAKQAGVANGHNGQFRPEDSMTREEGIAFIANFAEACGINVEVAAADIAAELAKYPDGAKVSGWAEECVAWACIADVAGNGAAINPKGTITRAEAAAMLVNYKGAFVK